MADEWYYSRDKQQLGPVTRSRLGDLAAAGDLRPGDLVWRDGMAEWAAASRVEGLFRAADSAPAAPRGVRPGPPPPPDDRPVGPRKGPWIAAGICIAGMVVAAAAVGGYLLTRRPAGDSPAGFSVTASELMRELAACRTLADAEFQGKPFTVAGKVVRSPKAWDDSHAFHFEGTEGGHPYRVRCSVGPDKSRDGVGYAAAAPLFESFKPGLAATVHGVFRRGRSDATPVLEDCLLGTGLGDSVGTLLRRYDAHKQAFDAKYVGKRLRISGGLVEADDSSDETYTLTYETDTEDTLQVACRFKAKYAEGLKRLAKGNQVVVEATFKGSKFTDFGAIELLDGDLISPREPHAQPPGAVVEADADAAPDRRSPRPAAPRPATPSGPGVLTQAQLDGMSLAQILLRLGPPDESYQGSRRRNVKLAVWNADGGNYVTVSYIEAIDGKSAPLVMTRNVNRPREVVEQMKRVTASQ